MKNRDDGSVWRCSWERMGDGFRAWVVSHPNVTSCGQDWEQVRDALLQRIDEELHAGEWVADWGPPQPVREGSLFALHPDYVVLVPNGTFVLSGRVEDYYSEPACPKCTKVRGERNDRTLRIQVESLAGIMFSFRGSSIKSCVYRGTTLEALGSEKLAGGIVRKVERLGRGRTELFEVVPNPKVKEVATRGATLHGYRCRTCMRAFFCHRVGQANYVSVYPKSSIPEGAMSFWVDDPQPHLCVRTEWWKSVRQTPAFKGIMSWGLHVAEDEHIDADPELRIA